MLPSRVCSDSNSEWVAFVVAVTSSNGLSEIIRRAMCTSKKKTASLLGDSMERMTGMEGWQPDRKLLQIIEELRREGRL
jgi:hypothetical protein